MIYIVLMTSSGEAVKVQGRPEIKDGRLEFFHEGDLAAAFAKGAWARVEKRPEPTEGKK